ncbi:MAG: iron hydrogenase small subunit, partial [Clostridium sp.]|nr:iron hydrogenase small subunit [Clostridium sp.]
ASGLANAGKLIEKLLAKEVSYDFVEIMACPGGCVNGGGQPVPGDASRQTRADGLYSSDRTNTIKSCDTNPLIERIYADFVKGRNHELFHVHYPAHHAE